MQITFNSNLAGGLQKRGWLVKGRGEDGKPPSLVLSPLGGIREIRRLDGLRRGAYGAERVALPADSPPQACGGEGIGKSHGGGIQMRPIAHFLGE